MNLLNSVLKLFLGDKKKRDLKELQPIVDRVHTFEQEITSLTNDELRQKTSDFRQIIKEKNKDFLLQIETLTEEAKTAEVSKKEEIYNEIDRLENEMYAQTQKTLNEIQPIAFAVVKETAKRFTNHKTIPVTATPFDRELSAKRDFVTINGD
ncbi:MAG: preprotein translocase subunit SecA, partial [Flavobacteriaceae bacterium]|nr:preprotein translocase subunit SecA [Flavobacteriaceae bacterium]